MEITGKEKDLWNYVLSTYGSNYTAVFFLRARFVTGGFGNLPAICESSFLQALPGVNITPIV